MMSTILERLFTKPSSRKTTPVRKRQLRLETLESRELLSVSIADFAAIRSEYADLNLEAYDEYNIIEITELTDAKLRSAVNQATTNLRNDLIVIRTTATNNTIALNSKLSLQIAAKDNGSTTIVSYGDEKLTILGYGIEISSPSNGSIIPTFYPSDTALAGLVVTGVNGTGISCTLQSTVKITDCIISYNSGYGIFTNRSTVTVMNCTITHNSNGGIYNSGGIYNNGIMSAHLSSLLTVVNSFITDNSSNTHNGGGIYNDNTELVLKNCLITGNKVEGTSVYQYGGGIYNSGKLTMVNCTVTKNSAKYGGGIVHYFEVVNGGRNVGEPSADIYNTIVIGNTSDYGGDIQHYNGNEIRGSNNLTALLPSSWGGNSYNNIIYDSAEPLFVSTANRDYRLAADSQAIDKGNNVYALSITKDLAGNDRKIGGVVDIGAYEYRPTPAGLPDLTAYPYSVWGGAPILLAKGITSSENASTFLTTDEIFYNLAYINSGSATATSHTVSVVVSSGNTTFYTKNYNSSDVIINNTVGLGSNSASIGKLAAGNYIITVTLDSNNTVAESNENNNVFSKTFTVTAVPTAPDAPTVTKSLDNNGKPKLTWNAVAGAVTYRVYRLNADGKGWTNISGNNLKATSFTDTSVPSGVHTYAVRAFAVDGATGSAFVSAKYATVAVTPDAPTVTKILENGKPKLTWNAVTGAVAYRVYRLNADGLGWTNVSGNALKATTFTDTGLSAAGVYTYAVRAFLNDGVTGSAFVNTKYATIGVTPTAPTVTASLDNGKPKLSWNAVTGAVAYRVYRLNDAGNGWDNVSGNALKAVTFTDATAQAGKTYTYSVQAFLNDGITGSGFVGARYVTVTTGVAGDVGDTFATAAVISFTNNTFTKTESIGTAGDIDVYQLSVEAGRTYTFVTSLPSGKASVDTVIRLFDANGNQLDYNDDDFPFLYSRLTYKPNAAGIYYLSVFGFGSSTGDYTLTVTKT